MSGCDGRKVGWDEYVRLVTADLGRYGVTRQYFWRYLIRCVELRFVFFMRTVAFLKGKTVLLPFFVLTRFIYGRMQMRYGLNIPYSMSIGPGLLIGHYGGVVVNQDVKIGKNCNLNHGVTLGVAYGGKSPGCPVIGDNVFLGAGCKVFGGIRLGDDVAVGANCVVTKSVPDFSVVGGVPGKIISKKGSAAYVVNRMV